MEILDVVVRWPGSTHDSRVFDNSAVKARFEAGQLPGILLGDSGYPCLPYLMTPFLNPLTRPQQRYNRAHKRTRNLIECAFGVMKRRFPCLTKGLATKLRTSVSIIVACTLLYNIGIIENDEVPEYDDEEPGPDRRVPHRIYLGGAGRAGAAGREIRQAIVTTRFTRYIWMVLYRLIIHRTL
jgi:nuclease HARBI1